MSPVSCCCCFSPEDVTRAAADFVAAVAPATAVAVMMGFSIVVVVVVIVAGAAAAASGDGGIATEAVGATAATDIKLTPHPMLEKAPSLGSPGDDDRKTNPARSVAAAYSQTISATAAA
jgi:alpha/beta superfamily hydrolase